MKKTVLIIIDQLGVGGAERQLLLTLPGLINDKREIIVFTFLSGGAVAEQLRMIGVRVLSPMRAGRFTLPIRMLTLIRLLWVIKPDVLHFYLPRSYLLGALCSFFGPAKIKLMSRRSLNNYQKKHPWFSKIEKYLHRYMTLIIGNSSAIVRQLQLEEGVPQKKLRLIYNGIDIQNECHEENQNKLKAALNISSQSLVLIIVANLFPYKGHADLLEALYLAKNKLPDDWVLLCVGRDEHHQSDLEHYVNAHQLSSHVRWLGERMDVMPLLSISDIAILVSHEEGFSNSLLEAMKAKLPLIVTDVGGNPEAVINNKTGYVVPAKNPQAISEKLVCLAHNPELRQKMGFEGYQYLKAHFSLEACIDLYENIYDDVLCVEGRSRSHS